MDSVQLPQSLKTIEEDAFRCTTLTSITIPDNVTTIGSDAFYNSDLKSVELGKNLQTIGNYAFYECSNLTEITIPENVTTIGYGAFAECKNLTTVYFNAIDCNNGKPLDAGWFNYLKNLVIGLKVKSIPHAAFSFCPKLETLVIPANVKTIGFNSFNACKNLKSVTLEEGLERIEAYAFYKCESLTEITIPNSVTYIGPNAFANCNEDLKINIEDESLLLPPEPIPQEGYWDELWLGLGATVGGIAIVLVILLVIAFLSALAMNIIYLVGCVKLTRIYCRKKQKSAGGLTVLAVILSLLGVGFWYLLIIAILNHGEKAKTV